MPAHLVPTAVGGLHLAQAVLTSATAENQPEENDITQTRSADTHLNDSRTTSSVGKNPDSTLTSCAKGAAVMPASDLASE